MILLGAALVAVPPDYDRFLEAGGPDAAGVPSFTWAERGLVSDQFEPELAAREHLARMAPKYGFEAADVDRLALIRVHDIGVGAIIVSFRGEVGGLPVFRDEFRVIMKRDFELVAVSGHVLASAMHPAAHAGGFELSADAALSAAAIDLVGALFAPSDFSSVEKRGQWTWFDGPRAEGPFGSIFPEPSRVRRVVYAMPGFLRPAYHVELVAQRTEGPSSEMFGYVIDAIDGRILFRRNLTDQDDFTYRVYAEPNLPYRPLEGPQGDVWLPHPTGVWGPFTTSTATAVLVTLENGPISTNDPWLPSGATETFGNNVDAYADLEGPDGRNGNDFRAAATSTNTFDYPHDITANAASSVNQQLSGIVQLFFINNYLHDLFYEYGFDEAAGNAQGDNFGRGGEEGDVMLAEAQDYSGTNNANMSTRADGARVRMQMYVWSGRSHASIDIAAPSANAGSYVAGTARFGPADMTATGALTIVRDDDGDPLDGCTAYTNAAAVAGRIALVARGNCGFSTKAQRAEDAGAVGIVLTDNRFGGIPPDMNSNPPTTMSMVSVTEALGDAIRLDITGGSTVTVTIRAIGRANYDSGLDGTVVAHEWGHYLSNRLIGNASGLSVNQSRGMGEGWSDFVGLFMSVTADDINAPANANWTGTFGVGVNSSYRNPYFGIRRVPYSVDFAKDHLTFGMIENGVPIPTTIPVQRNWDGNSNSQVHRTGEVWATMLWECYVTLLRDPNLTFEQAQTRMGQYLVASLAATPMNPTVIEARNAVLAVAYANDPADFDRFYRAFARRGAGLGAEAPPRTSTNHVPTIESFAIGNALEVEGIWLNDEGLYCDRDGVLDAGETGQLRVEVRNIGVAALSQTTLTVTTQDPRVAFPNGATVSFPTFDPFGTSEAIVDVELNGSSEIHEVEFDLVVEDPTLIGTATVGATAAFRVNSDVVNSSTTTDDVEAPNSPWVATNDPSLARAQRFERVEVAASEHRWFCPNVGSPSDNYLTSLPFTVSSSTAPNAAPFTIAFSHRYDIEEGWDGAVVELTNDGGNSWTDIVELGGGVYDRTLRNNTPNPLDGQPAWTGNNASYPDLDRVTLDLGTAFAGQTVQLRFRFGTDTAAAGIGWEIDDISLGGIDGTPFPTLVVDDGVCINRPPIADAGPDLAVDEGTTVTIDTSGTTDPDGDTLTLIWAQLSGPQVTVDQSGTFDVPFVDEETTIELQLTVLDAESADTVRLLVTVLNSNRSAEVDAGPDQEVDENSTVQLTGSITDPDGDAFTFSWRQVRGPNVTLTADDTLSPTFEAPMTEGHETLVFELSATEREHTTTDTATITVGHVNRPPTITVSDDQAVDAGADVTISATAEDPDGDTVTITWRQVEGPAIELADGSAATTTFTAPTQDEASTIVLEAEASDGDLTATARTTIQVAARPEVKDPKDLEEDGGCSCSTAERRRSSPWWLLGLFAVFVVRRRR